MGAPRHRPAACALAAVLWLAAGCGSSDAPDGRDGAAARAPARTPPPPGTFRGGEAFGHLEALMACGPRIPGSRGSREAEAYCRRVFAAAGAAGSSADFEVADPAENRTYAMRNLFFRFHPDQRPRILLATHYDTRRFADRDPDTARRRRPVPGANDGGSGVAVYLALASVLRERPPPFGVDVALFDGEDFGREGSDDYCQGSRRFAAHPPSWAGAVSAAVVLDLVGDRDLGIHEEGFSREFAPALVDRFWSSARAAGAGDVFHRGVKYRILDDHVPLHRQLGLPAILVIDFDYQGVFHTVDDTLEMCSARSLQKVGDTLVHFLYTGPPWNETR